MLKMKYLQDNEAKVSIPVYDDNEDGDRMTHQLQNTNLVSPSPYNLLSRSRRYVTSKTKNILTYLYLLQDVPNKMGFKSSHYTGTGLKPNSFGTPCMDI